MISKSITKYSSNCKVCMYEEYQRLFFQCMHADQIVTYFQISSYNKSSATAEDGRPYDVNKRLCLHRRCVEYLATGNFYLLA